MITDIENEMKKANLLSEATQKLLSLQQNTMADVSKFTADFNNLLSNIHQASGIP